MDKGGFAYALERDVKQFNGYLFKNRTVLPLPREEIGELFEAAKADWQQVEPAIFGTLLEQALESCRAPKTRRALYAPRLCRTAGRRDHYGASQGRMGECTGDGGSQGGRRSEERRRIVRKLFTTKLCDIRILDPACGTGKLSLCLARIDEAARRRSSGGAGPLRRAGPLCRL